LTARLRDQPLAGISVRAMIAKHVLKHIGKNVKIFHGVEISYGYNLTSKTIV